MAISSPLSAKLVCSGNATPTPKSSSSRLNSLSCQVSPVVASVQLTSSVLDDDGLDSDSELTALAGLDGLVVVDELALILGGGSLAHVFPVALALCVAREIQRKSVETRFVDLEALRQNERQEPDLQSCALDTGERLSAKTRCVAQLGLTERDPQPRKDVELEIAFERQRSARRVLYSSRNLGLIVVRVEQQRDTDERDYEKTNEGTDDDAQYFQ